MFRWSIAAFVSALLPVPAVGQAPPTAFTHVAVIPMDRERLLEDQTVLVDSGRIVAIGKTGEVRIPEKVLVVDGQGKYLMPGLGNMHAHIEDATPRDSLPPPAEIERMMLRFLTDGFTTVRNMNGRPWTSPCVSK